jgi:hypothetical protein
MDLILPCCQHKGIRDYERHSFCSLKKLLARCETARYFGDFYS